MKNKKKSSAVTSDKNKEIKIKKETEFSKYALICRVTMSFCSFLLTSSFIFFIFYIAGNFQNFTDKVQLLILSVLTNVSIILLVSSIFGIIINFVFLIARVRISHRIISIIVYILMIIFAVVFILLASVINKLSLGI